MPPARVRCPNCRKEVAWENNPWRPFCSERCRLLDLGAWATDRYRIPGEDVSDEDHDEGDGQEKDRS